MAWLIGGALNWLLGLALAGGVLFGSYWWGWFDGVDHERAKWAGYAAEVQQALARERQELHALGSRLADELSTVKTHLASISATAHERIVVKTRTDRRCLDSDITRVLNATSSIRETVTPAGRADAPAAAPAANPDRHPPGGADDGSGASERSVAVGLLEARTGYEACRTQLHKLQDYVRRIVE